MALCKDGTYAVGSCLLACIEQVARRLPTGAERFSLRPSGWQELADLVTDATNPLMQDPQVTTA